MGSISDIHNPWRDALVPASFDGNEFFVDVGNKEGGRRLVVHQFPKKDTPYTEDMGRRATEFSVRGYCIQSYRQPDYRPARDALQARLDADGPGTLQLPTMFPMKVCCQQYRLTEDEQLGGYCAFDMRFVEAGAAPFKPAASPQAQLQSKAGALQSRTLSSMQGNRVPVS